MRYVCVCKIALEIYGIAFVLKIVAILALTLMVLRPQRELHRVGQPAAGPLPG